MEQNQTFLGLFLMQMLSEDLENYRISFPLKLREASTYGDVKIENHWRRISFVLRFIESELPAMNAILSLTISSLDDKLKVYSIFFLC